MVHAGILIGNTGYQRAGVANYVHQIVSRISQKTQITPISHSSANIYPNTHPYSPRYPPIPFNTILWSSVVSLQRKKLRNFDMIHNPAHFPLPYPCHKRYLMTIHDITPITMPWFHTRYRTLYTKYLVKRGIRQASHLISDSNCTKQDLVKYLHIDKDKISVIPIAADDSFFPRSESEINRVKQKYLLTNPFILFVGTIEPRKNIPTLLDAFYELRKSYPGYILVIAGQKGWKYEEMYRRYHQLNLDTSVRFLTYVPHQDLPALYCASDLFVFPSWYEGFGIPPLEAMQSGVPVVVSDRGSLPEIVGSGGCMVSPEDPHGLFLSMEMMLTDHSARTKQVQYNLNRARLFSWDTCVEKTARVYDQVLQLDS